MCDCICKNGCKCPQEPIDFSKAQVGDTVRCLLNGDVKITEIDSGESTDYPVEVKGNDWFMSDGKFNSHHRNPCLLGWVHPVTGKLCRTRPEPVIDWEQVPIDTPVEVDGVVQHFAKMSSDGSFPVFWCHGRTSHTVKREGLISQGVPFVKSYKLIKTEEQ